MPRTTLRTRSRSTPTPRSIRRSVAADTQLDPVDHPTGSFRVRTAPTFPTLGDGSDLVGRANASAATDRNDAFTAVRSLALVVVVLWHWVFATVRWDADGPHSGNPRHLVTGGFVLTWFLQVMPLFFLVGGWASWGSLTRHQLRGGSDQSWLRARAGRLAKPALPLALGLLAAKLVLSPWMFGVILLAASPLWFLGVYLPLTLLTPLLVRAHRRSMGWSFVVSFALVIATQIARFAYDAPSVVVTLVAFLAVWGLLYQVGFYLDRLRLNRAMAARVTWAGLIGIGVCVAVGYPASMVAVKGDAISNMGPPTLAIVMLGLFQAGLITFFAGRFEALSAHHSIGALIKWVDRNQMTIYIVHLPLWVLQLVLLRPTLLGLAGSPTLGWLITRPIWLLGPGYVLVRLLSVLRLVPQPRHS